MRKRVLLAVILLVFGGMLLCAGGKQEAETPGASFAKAFTSPGTEFRPKTRWWWPGGDVESRGRSSHGVSLSVVTGSSNGRILSQKTPTNVSRSA